MANKFCVTVEIVVAFLAESVPAVERDNKKEIDHMEWNFEDSNFCSIAQEWKYPSTRGYINFFYL